MALGGCAVFAVSAFMFDWTGADEAVPVRVTRSAASTMPGAALGANLPERIGELLAQQYGTVCQTPEGSICTVAPQAINSRCQCGQTYGLIVR